MLYQSRKSPRCGAVILECAIVYPITFLLVLGMIIGGLGVFRYQEVASLAREGSRYASLHGANYQQQTGKTAATQSEGKVSRDGCVAPGTPSAAASARASGATSAARSARR